jgi:PAS domain S-box-containing protein
MGSPQATTVRVVLVATDGNTVAQTLSEDQPQFSVDTVFDPESLVARLADADCVVSLRPPDADEFDVVASVRDHDRSLPVLVVTPDDADAAAALSAGAADVLLAEVENPPAALLATRIERLVAKDRDVDRREADGSAAAAGDGLAVLDPRGTFESVNESYAALYGYEPADLVGESWQVIYPDVEVDRIYDTILPVVEDRGEWRGESLAQRADRSTFKQEFAVTRLDDGRYVVIARDVSDRVALRRTLQDLQDLTNELLRATDLESITDLVFEAASDVLGLPAVIVLLYDEDADVLRLKAVSAMMEQAIETVPDEWPKDTITWEAFERGETLVYDQIADTDTTLSIQRPGTGAFIPLGEYGILVVGNPSSNRLDDETLDLADSLAAAAEAAVGRVKREQDLRAEQAFTESVLDALPDVFYVLDPDGSLRRWNERLPAVTVYGESELDGMSLLEMIHPDDRVTVRRAIDRAVHEAVTVTSEARIVTAIGDRAIYEFTATPLTDDAGEVVGIAGTAREVTERKLREQRLTVLARVLRHNVRNQMTVVQGRAERLQAREESGPDVAAINEAATDLVTLSDKARRVEAALRESTSMGLFDVPDVVRTTLSALSREFPDANMELDAPDALEAHTTEGLTFAVEELVRNGIIHNEHETPTVRVAIELEQSDDDYDLVAITVDDDGPGMPETEQPALTASHETDLDHATGLGLWLVNWVTTAAGGSLTCEESEALGGSAITLRFPAGE